MLLFVIFLQIYTVSLPQVFIASVCLWFALSEFGFMFSPPVSFLCNNHEFFSKECKHFTDTSMQKETLSLLHCVKHMPYSDILNSRVQVCMSYYTSYLKIS